MFTIISKYSTLSFDCMFHFKAQASPSELRSGVAIVTHVKEAFNCHVGKNSFRRSQAGKILLNTGESWNRLKPVICVLFRIYIFTSILKSHIHKIYLFTCLCINKMNNLLTYMSNRQKWNKMHIAVTGYENGR